MSNIEEALKKLFSHKDDTKSVVFEWDHKNKVAIITHEGVNGLDDVRAHLDASKVMLALFAVKSIDKDDSVETQRTYYVQLPFVGVNVKPLLRRDLNSLRNAITNAVKSGLNVHVTMEITSVEDIKVDELEKRLLNACGSHKPKGFQW
ncbi:hypothetical protein FDP41_000212 [Naegleria fowleri]|uniref:ADF-H domain-containing protein n=1 Tax=Naegleria fowleri TaxID=5763 RepID=A0A6A5C433_NAEFO|nr:uncharacterized protein FDP41_000212 [Naegleria fowleri]KAF0985173.1 hypothetical protein FDP41_000212 [Naegleria fowleri]CAG4710031.1 unnamed protein product [Naegleria fowleri]